MFKELHYTHIDQHRPILPPNRPDESIALSRLRSLLSFTLPSAYLTASIFQCFIVECGHQLVDLRGNHLKPISISHFLPLEKIIFTSLQQNRFKCHKLLKLCIKIKQNYIKLALNFIRQLILNRISMLLLKIVHRGLPLSSTPKWCCSCYTRRATIIHPASRGFI